MAGVLCACGIAACGPVSDAIGDRDPPTPTHRPFTTATPGGKLSVWLITPTGQFAAPMTPAPGAVSGNPVGPNATATALMATVAAATATAGAPLPAPYTEPEACPLPGAPIPPPQPADFGDYSNAIGQFLSGGGSPTVLEATLRNWGAIRDSGGVVQGDTDITGNGVREVIITFYNPVVYNEETLLNAGQLIIFGCDNGGYRQLYKTPYHAGLAIPELSRVGDMNADVKNEVVFFTESCNQSGCYKDAKILTWNAAVGALEELNNGQIIAVNGRIGIADVDADGVLELTAQINPPGTIASGPPNSFTDIWDWNGADYVLAVREQPAGSRYHIHAIYEADDLLRDGEWRQAILLYADVRLNNHLASWTLPNENDILDAYCEWRIVSTYAALGSGRAEQWFTTLTTDNPPGSPGYGFAEMGQAFMDNFRATGDRRAACAAALGTPGATSALSMMNSYGYNNRSYIQNDLCPF
ncbi:MAG: hypothetical protein K8S97_16110 [Anaerolineae bacterium]|nr:hypothetical protein [Anaerolineae bacterium]